MKKDALILKDGTVISIETGASLSNVVVLFTDKETFLDTWDKLTEDNLSEVQIQNDAGLTIGRYSEIVLVNETSTIQEDGIISTSFCFREKTAIEKRMDTMESGQTVQDDAILKMADELTNTQMALTEAYEMIGGMES